MLAECGLPPRLRGKTLANYRRTADNGDAHKATWKFCADSEHWGPRLFDKGVLLYGPSGVGKTHLAAAVVNYMITVVGLFAYFQKVIAMPRNDQDFILRLADPECVPVLVLDDVGVDKSTGRSMECLQLVVDGRLDAGGVMFVTSNYGPDEMRARFGEYGDRIVGRLREACEWVAVGGKDWREEL